MIETSSLIRAADEAVDQLHTARDFIRWGVSRFTEAELFFGHGSDNALDEAVVLVLHALHLAPGVPDPLLEAELTRSEKRAVADLLARRIGKRIPAPYLTRKAWFAGVEFYVDSRVLIPRSPLAEWIERRFSPWLDADRVSRIADIGTGSGCIAVACAFAFPAADVDAVDISPEALEVARVNIEAHELTGRIQLLQSDLFDKLSGRYDLIVSNPPYVGAADLAGMPAEYRHEPVLGLEAGEDGLRYVGRLLRGAANRLTSSGVLVTEVGASRPALEEAFPRVAFTWLELEHGGENVFLLTREELDEAGVSDPTG